MPDTDKVVSPVYAPAVLKFPVIVKAFDPPAKVELVVMVVPVNVVLAPKVTAPI